MSNAMTLTLIENGPGIMTLPHGTKMALCRCGLSGQIMCNGAHKNRLADAPIIPGADISVHSTETECIVNMG